MSNFVDPRVSSNSVSSIRSGGRGRHQIKRSITELTSPVRLGRHHRKDRYHDERAPQSAIPNLNSLGRFSLDMPRSEGVTPMMSPDQSRRPSVMLQREEEENKVGNGLNQTAPQLNQEEKFREEREKGSTRIDGLKQSLDQLGTFSTTTSRKLDETYYAVLEKMSTLQNTVGALKDLAETAQNIHRGFEKDSREIENDITLQLASLGQFQEHQGNIECLQARIQNGRAKIRALSERVDVVRTRVESWERADNEWQERTRKRLRSIWIFLSIGALVITVLSLGARYVHPDFDVLHMDTGRPLRAAESMMKSHFEAGHAHSTSKVDQGDTRETPEDEDEPLRVFDEL